MTINLFFMFARKNINDARCVLPKNTFKTQQKVWVCLADNICTSGQRKPDKDKFRKQFSEIFPMCMKEFFFL